MATSWQAVPERKRILLLDPDETLRHLRRIIFETHGFKVDPARDAAHARSKWRPGSHDLVLADGSHSLQPALEFCEEIKRLSPEQLYLLLVNSNVFVPRSSCPDEVLFRDDGPQQLIERVKALLT